MFGIIPIGKIEASILKYLEQQLKVTFDEEVKILSQIELPNYAYSSLRKQYNARTILTSDIWNPEGEKPDKIVAVINKDLYSPELNFVFGEFEKVGGKKAIISIVRLREELRGLPADKSLCLERVLKEVTHELGHLCGMPNCPNPKCVMYFSNSLLSIDTKGENFCRACQARLRSKTE